jgi:P-type Ca2+ transporter type 2C
MLTVNLSSNRRLDNKLNIFENIHHNYFFIIINLIMIGGQVLIIFVGGEAFKIRPLDGKEWGLSVGLGAISVPWGALIRLFPDEWVGAMLPWFIRKKWAPETISDDDQEQHRAETPGVHKPLRTLTTLRGSRATKNIRRGLRERMHDAKEKAKDKMHVYDEESQTNGFKNKTK